MLLLRISSSREASGLISPVFEYNRIECLDHGLHGRWLLRRLSNFEKGLNHKSHYWTAEIETLMPTYLVSQSEREEQEKREGSEKEEMMIWPWNAILNNHRGKQRLICGANLKGKINHFGFFQHSFGWINNLQVAMNRVSLFHITRWFSNGIIAHESQDKSQFWNAILERISWLV